MPLGSAVKLTIATPEDMHALGVRIGSHLVAGDVLVLNGPLGAGKTKLVQGIGEGLSVEGQITSPTFVVARVHRSAIGGPELVHVDAYRLSGLDDLETLGIDDHNNAVVVMEWGAPFADALNSDQLHIDIERSDEGTDIAPESGLRVVTMRGIGARWNSPVLSQFETSAS